MFEHQSFGNHLKLSVRGASHAPSIAFRLSGLPKSFKVDQNELAVFMARRAPGRDACSTARREADAVAFERFSDGVFEGHVRNTDIRPTDYGDERCVPRPGHADFGQWIEFGRIPTGGGANSGRMTVALCAAGGICKQWLARRGVTVEAHVVRIGAVTEPARFEEEILAAKQAGDSVGGVIACVVNGVRPGLGGALFAGLESALSAAIFAIPGVKGIEFGNGFEAAALRGSANNDPFIIRDGAVRTDGNRHGGILGGRATGMPIAFRVAMKPTPTIFQPQDSVNLATGAAETIAMKGRHDPCIVLRALPVVEAMTAFALADAMCAADAATPRLCLTLTGRTLAENARQYAAQRYFADMVEWRIDLLDAGEREQAVESVLQSRVPVIVTFRRRRDGGAFTGDENERAAFFRMLLTRVAARDSACRELYVDFEDDFRKDELTQLAKRADVRIIRSLHDFSGKPADLVACCERLRGATDEIPKVAFMPRNPREVFETFYELNGFGAFPHVVCAMGPMGLVTRVLASRTGSMLTYASLGGLEDIGHVSPQDLVRTYRFRTLTADTTLYGVTGWPLTHTRSPDINNRAWADADEDAVMIPFPSKDAAEALDFMRSMKMKGLAVTIPHKQEIIPYLTRCDKLARAVGAVNTVVARSDGTFVGCNTDCEGFTAAIRAFVGREDFAGLNVAVLGAGGASKAVVHAHERLHARVQVFHRRTPPKGFDLIVNATPVDPIPDYAFTGREMVYDLVYVPAETALMARARAAGCRVENGFTMLVAQAAAQRRIWSSS